MTTLTITPNWKNKTAKFKGTVAAGEHVAVTIANENGGGSAYITSTTNLRLNVIGPAGRLLATFPEPVEEGETPATWGSDTGVLTCTLNLNTVQMLKAVPPAANVPLLFVLDAYSETTPEFTLYFKDRCEVEHWPRRVGEEEPVDLDGYQDFVADMESAWEEYKAGIDEDLEAQDASISALETSKADAVELAEHIADTDNPHSVTKEQLGLGNVDNTADMNKPVSSATATAIAAAKSYAAGLAAAEETRARAAESALEAGKADAEDVYTKAQVDAAIAAASPADYDVVKGQVLANASAITGIEGKIPGAASSSNKLVDQQSMNNAIATAKNGRFVKVNSLPESGETMVIYLVPRQDEEEGNVYDEYIWTDGEWEKLGSTDVQLTEEDPLFAEWKGGYSIALGSDADADPDRSTMAIGVLANCEAGNSIAFGRNATVAYPLKGYDSASEFPETGTAGIFYVAADTGKMYRWSQPEGSSAYTYVDTGKTIDLDTVNYYKGWFFSANTAIGYDAKVSYDFENGDGEFNPVPTQGAIALGTHTNVTGSFGVAMGYGAEVSGRESVAIGDGAKATHEDAVVIGHNAVSHGDDTVNLHSTALDKIYLGSNTIQDLINAAVNTAIANATIPAAVSTTTATGGGRRLLAAATPTSTTKTEVTPSDIGALPTSGGQVTGNINLPDGAGRNYALRIGTRDNNSDNGIWWLGLVADCGICCGSLLGNMLIVSEGNIISLPSAPGTLALVSQIYAAVQQIAPDFTAKTYVLNELCSYNGVVYRCKSAYTATARSTKPSGDTTHWEAKKVSELFLGNSGIQTLDGMLVQRGSGPNRITKEIAFENIASDGMQWAINFNGLYPDVQLLLPTTDGTLALLSDILVKSVKLNGTALQPDANGAVDVQALPLAGGTMMGDISTANAIWLTNSGMWTGILQINGDGALQSLVGGVNINASFADIIKTALGLSPHYAPLASPAFTGTPTAPTPTAGDNSTKVATTAFVKTAVDGISVTPLSGNTYDFSTMQGVFDALKAAIEALGGTVTNAPTSSQGE